MVGLRMAGNGFTNFLEAVRDNSRFVVFAVLAVFHKAEGNEELLQDFMLVLRQLGNGSGIGFQLLAGIGELRAQKRVFVGQLINAV